MVTKGTTRRGKKLKIAEKHVITISAEYLIGLYYKQNGLCAISGMKMTHRYKDLRSISIDRIDSTKGYIKGNVQLVCQWVNLAKGQHSDHEFKQILAELRG